MIAEVNSLGLHGISGFPVTVECHISSGLPGFDVVGLPDAAVKEARERVRAAVKNSGWPSHEPWPTTLRFCSVMKPPRP